MPCSLYSCSPVSVIGWQLWTIKAVTYVDDVKSLLNGGLGIEGEASVDLSGDLAGDDLENLLAELDQQTVKGVVNLRVDITALALAVLDGNIHELGVLGLFRGGQDQGGVGGSILGLVLGNGCCCCCCQ